jgi:hypothetical protein
MNKIDTTRVDNVVVDIPDTSDYPDFSDAYIESADLDGVPMTDEELDDLNCDSDFVYDEVIKYLY